MSYPGGIMPRAGRRLSLLLAGAAALAASAAVVAQDLSIREYKPKSTLVVPAHPVPRAKYPVIDVHSHHSRLTAPAYGQVVREMDALNLRVLVNLSGGSGEGLKGMLAMIAASPAPDRMVVFANLDFSDVDVPGYGRRAAARLEADVAAGGGGGQKFKRPGVSAERAA